LVPVATSLDNNFYFRNIHQLFVRLAMRWSKRTYFVGFRCKFSLWIFNPKSDGFITLFTDPVFQQTPNKIIARTVVSEGRQIFLKTEKSTVCLDNQLIRLRMPF
jgi:hypothetical protein